MSDKCHWCGQVKEIKEEFEYYSNKEKAMIKACSADCKHDVLRFLSYFERNLRRYILLLLLVLTAGVYFIFNRMMIDYGALGLLIIFSGAGIILIMFPFVTPQTIHKHGLQKGIFIGRMVGLINIFIGLAFWLVLNWFF